MAAGQLTPQGLKLDAFKSFEDIRVMRNVMSARTLFLVSVAGGILPQRRTFRSYDR
jgi:hypothetical protein